MLLFTSIMALVHTKSSLPEILYFVYVPCLHGPTNWLVFNLFDHRLQNNLNLSRTSALPCARAITCTLDAVNTPVRIA